MLLKIFLSIPSSAGGSENMLKWFMNLGVRSALLPDGGAAAAINVALRTSLKVQSLRS